MWETCQSWAERTRSVLFPVARTLAEKELSRGEGSESNGENQNPWPQLPKEF
jgi:hypothetical protein